MLSNAFSMIIDTRWCLDELLKDGIIDQRDYHLIDPRIDFEGR